MSHDDESMGDFWRGWKDATREKRARLGIECPTCREVRPKSNPTILMPGRICKLCGTTYSMAKLLKTR